MLKKIKMGLDKFEYFGSGSYKKEIYTKSPAFKSYNVNKRRKINTTYHNTQKHLEDFHNDVELTYVFCFKCSNRNNQDDEVKV
jgi:hypothetical protein